MKKLLLTMVLLSSVHQLLPMTGAAKKIAGTVGGACTVIFAYNSLFNRPSDPLYKEVDLGEFGMGYKDGYESPEMRARAANRVKIYEGRVRHYQISPDETARSEK